MTQPNGKYRNGGFMITYTYKCSECNYVFGTRQHISDNKLTDCPECGTESSLNRLITNTNGAVLKGGGWFGKSKG